jgi:hypothetical protein
MDNVTWHYARDGWSFATLDVPALRVVASIEPVNRLGVCAYTVWPPGRPDLAAVEGRALTYASACAMVDVILSEHQPIA